jgi:predicted component of type VI protein secretion system
MSKDTLRKSLERLHEELAATSELDPQARALLSHVAADIERVLAGGSAHSQSLPEQVEEAAVRFEADHPHLARTLNEITDALARLGV